MESGGSSRPTEPQGPPRNIALFTSSWGSNGTVYAWTWLKQYLLRRVPAPGGMALDPRDRLFIVHVGKTQQAGWKVGGPLIADLDTALASYPHETVELEGSLQSNVRSFVEKLGIDLIVLGDRFPQVGFKIGSVVDWVKQHVTCPFIIVRPEVVRNIHMRIDNGIDLLHREGSAIKAAPPPLPVTRGRKVAVCYSTHETGLALIAEAKRVALCPADTVYVVHVFSEEPVVVKQTRKIVRAMTLQKPRTPTAVPDAAPEFGARELEGYKVQLNVVLKGEPREAIIGFCESEGIDLVVIGSRTHGVLRKKLSGGSTSGYLVDHAPCPCLVLPYRFMGLADASDEEGGQSPTPGEEPPLIEGLELEGPSGSTLGAEHSSPSDMLSVLRQQLEEKDAVIAELKGQLHALQLERAQLADKATHGAAARGDITY